jgi:hypothetical protein
MSIKRPGDQFGSIPSWAVTDSFGKLPNRGGSLSQPSEAAAPVEADYSKTRPLGGKGGRPLSPPPLLGPPGPEASNGPTNGWASVPTRQNYEDKIERGRQNRYLAKYGTIEPRAGEHF